MAYPRQSCRARGCGRKVSRPVSLILPLLLLMPAPAMAREDEPFAAIRDVVATGSLPASKIPATSGSAVSEERLMREIIALYGKGDTAGADRLASAIGDHDMRVLLEWVAIRAGGPSIRHARIAAFIEANPDWPGLQNIRRRAEEALMQEHAAPGVVNAFFLTRQPVTAPGRIALAQAQMGTAQEAEAIQAVRRSWRQDPMGKQLESIVLARFGEYLTPADHRSRTERYLFRDQREAALRNASRIGEGYVKLAQARLASARKAGASPRQIEAVPPELRHDISFAFLRAQTLRRQDKPVEAALAIAGVTKDPDLLGDGDEWWVERRLIARKLLDIGRAELAYRVAAEHGAVSGPMIVEAEWHAGWIALQFLKQPARAASHFARAASISETPISVARAAYWQGRAAEALGLIGEAEDYFSRAARHPVAYYGQLARRHLGRTDFAVRKTPPAAPGSQPGLAAARMLYTHDDTRALGTALLLELARHLTNAADLEAAARLAHQAGDARTLLAFGKIALQRGFPLDTAAFPLGGVPDFSHVGAPVERAVVHAIARQESAFDPKAVSHAGARGLMQMMPATARETARRTKMPFDLNLLTADPAYCAQLGAAHLGELMAEWNGAHMLVFAAYNAGSGNVRDWIDAYGDPRDPQVDALDWIERIPFSETRNYVQRVSENLGIYRHLLIDRLAPTVTADLIRAAGRD